MFEYAVTNGKGTLIAHGIIDEKKSEFGLKFEVLTLISLAHIGGGDVLLAKCDKNCLTGK